MLKQSSFAVVAIQRLETGHLLIEATPLIER
jgi:hypothetical protein